MGPDLYPRSPVFPPELERVIFEITAQDRPLSIPALMLVGKRVKFWLEPLLYRTIVLADPATVCEGYIAAKWQAFTAVIQSKPPPFFRDSVRHLLLSSSVPPEAAALILVACSGVEDLSIQTRFTIPNLLTFISSLPKRLYCNLTEIFPSPWEMDFTHRLFSQITHIAITEYVEDELDIWRGLALIPHLSHLSFTWTLYLPLFPVLLHTCKSLKVLVVVDEDLGGSIEDSVADLAEDPRFISMPAHIDCIQDWQNGVHTGVDDWSMAEDFIAKRRSGEIDRLQYRISEEEYLKYYCA
ncbi:hypothetical protein C8R43DRAFT_699744 [Mycena crocata]|nr:hypothetical protein C8R43DRAFT_699744 [Mycena crocata]